MAVGRLTTAKNVYYIDKVIASGTSKDVYFTEDGQSVVEFYRDPTLHNDPSYRNRLTSLCGQFNLTLPRSEGGAAKSSEEAERMRKLFCWPTGVTVSPKLGFLAPVFPERYWFKADPRNLPVKDTEWLREEKKAAWFTIKRVWKTLARRERGDLLSSIRLCLLLSHAVSKLHMMGLAHSDLSANNILIDPLPSSDSSGWPGCLVIDLDTLVVPGFYPPAVIGTKGYIAPEVLATSRLPSNVRRFPGIATDKHALAVIIYELLLHRHPLDGPKMRSDESEEEDEFLAFGQDALFIEHPQDGSNHPKRNLKIAYSHLGKLLASSIERAFVDGLQDPAVRPLASEWESSLWKTLDLLHPCNNSTCLWQWFVCDNNLQSSCPWCGSQALQNLPILQFINRNGTEDRQAGKVVCWSGRQLHKWHVEHYVTPLPFEDSSPVVEFKTDINLNRWFVLNLRCDGMRIISPYQKVIHRGMQEPLTSGTIMQMGAQPTNRLVRFTIETNF